jgi:hypothetical protein
VVVGKGVSLGEGVSEESGVSRTDSTGFSLDVSGIVAGGIEDGVEVPQLVFEIIDIAMVRINQNAR